MVLANGPIQANRPKWLGEGAKGLLGQGSKSLKKGICTTKTLFCTGATQHFTGAKGIWPDCTQRPFAPSPNHFGRFPWIRQFARTLVAQCSATPATVAATPPCSATPFQTQISVRHLPAQGGGRCDTKTFRGCSATPVLHLQNAIKSRKSAATRVARQGVPAIVCN